MVANITVIVDYIFIRTFKTKYQETLPNIIMLNSTILYKIN